MSEDKDIQQKQKCVEVFFDMQHAHYVCQTSLVHQTLNQFDTAL